MVELLRQLLRRLDRLSVLIQQLNHTLKEAAHAMATIQDLKDAADQLAANEAALASEVGTLSTAVGNLVTVVDQLRQGGNLSPADQQKLDDATAEVTSASTDLATETQSLTAEQTAAENAANPAPPPAPQG